MKKHYLILILFLSTVSYITLAQSHWETAVLAEDEWTYFEGVSQPDFNWNLSSYDVSSWKKGKGGLGNGDNDDATEVEQCTVLYSRIDFELSDPKDILSALIHADYDDGIIIYLNGQQIVRSNVGSPALYTTLATANHEAQMYKGGQAEMFIVDPEVLSSALQKGSNTLAVQVHNVTAGSSDMSSIVYFSMEVKAGKTYFGATPDWFFKPEVISSKLPLIIIETDETINKNAKVTAQMKIVNNGAGVENKVTDPATDYDGYIGIKIRGNQSSGYAQKPYSIETRDSLGENNNVSLFGLPKENDWNLVNNLKDKTCINHALGYQLSRQMNFWAAHTQHCEVVVNGEAKGIYVFMESLKVDDNRVDIAKLKPEEVMQPDLSGGYIFKVDYYSKDLSDSWEAWYHPWDGSKDVHYVYHTPEPEDIVAEQKAYIQDWVEEFEQVLYSSDYKNPTTGYRAYIDVPSFINYLLINEVAMNGDAYKKSCHFHKDKNRNNERALLNAGPVWDMDWAFRDFPNANRPTFKRTGLMYAQTETIAVSPNPNTWMAQLMRDEQFANEVRTTYEYYRGSVFSLENVMQYIDSITTNLSPALDQHYEVWYDGATNAQDLYLGEVDSLKKFITNRLVYLDESLPGTVIDWADFLPSPVTYAETTASLSQDAMAAGVKLYPNPCQSILNIKGEGLELFRLYTLNGQLLAQEQIYDDVLSLNLSHLNAGLYVAHIITNDGRCVSKKLQLID